MTNEELEQLGKILETKLEAEREQTRKLVREVLDAVKGVAISNTRLEHRMDGVEQGLAQTNKTVLQINTVVETTEETVNNMDAGLKEVVKDHRERIEALEKEHRSSHKN